MRNIEDAKKIFEQYKGSYFGMAKDEILEQYKSYGVPKELESMWLQESLNQEKERFFTITDKQEMVESIDRIAQYNVRLKDVEGLRSVFEYIISHYALWDTQTALRCMRIYFNNINLYNISERKPYIYKGLDVLMALKRKEITISDDYIENGVMPNYISEERIKEDIDRMIKGWKQNL